MIQSKLKSVGEALRRLLTTHPATTVGVALGSEAIQFAEVRWIQGKPELIAAGIEKIPANSVKDGCILNEETLVESLRRIWALHGIKSKHVVVSLSGQNVFLRELLFPAMSDEELRQAIKWELDKYIPSADAENYYFDFVVLESAKNLQSCRVLLVAAPLAMINRMTRVLKEAGLKPIALDIEPLALQRTMKQANNAIVVDIDDECCKLTLFQQGFPLVARFIPFSGAGHTEVLWQTLEPDLSKAEKRTTRYGDEPVAVSQQDVKSLVAVLAREIRRTIDYYQMQNRDAFIDKIIVTGGRAQLGNLAANLAELLPETEVVVHSPVMQLQLSPSLSKERMQEIELPIAVAIGLALRGSDENNGG
ncbi:MAG: ftsA 1 [Firmicutes bacterium]|nr:ftsA 1 [Bacillota bacterium]